MEGIKTREQIAREYDVSVRNFYRWINKILPDLIHQPLTPKYQKMIYEEFGCPACVLREAYAHV